MSISSLVEFILGATFEEYDKDRSGFLERHEVARLLKDAFEAEGAGDLIARVDEANEEFFARLDRDGDGRFSKKELAAALEPLIKDILEKDL